MKPQHALIFILTVISSFCLATQTQQKPTAAATKKTTAAPTTQPIQTNPSEVVPKLKNGEYAIYLEDYYKVFTTKTFEKLELTSDCFKNSKPKCMAYSVGIEKPHPVKIKDPESNNLAVLSCIQIGGKNFVALDHKNNEYNFCRFSDGSMVTAWSMYFKHNPVPTIK